MIKWLAMTIPLMLPLAGYLIGLKVGGGRLLAGVLGSGLAGSATGMFFGSVAAAMASAKSSEEALLKGGGIGLALGVGVGLVLAALTHVIRSRRHAGTAVVLTLVALSACASPSPDSGTTPDSAVADSSHAPAGGTVPGASAAENENAAIEGTGTVRFVDLEGGCWAIDLDGAGGATGERLQPASLAEEFRVDSLRVRVRARPVSAMSFCMLGRVVEIESIERAAN